VRLATSTLLRASALASVVLLAGGCATTVIVAQSRTEMESARTGPVVKGAAELAPQQFRRAEDLRDFSLEAEAHKDNTGADLYAERAVVAYQRAVVLARLARAITAGEAASASAARDEAEAQRVAAARVEFEKSAEATAAELAVARQVTTRVPIGPADAAREKARLAEARSLAAEGHLLCGAARLIGRGAPAGGAAVDTGRLEAAEHEGLALEASLARPIGPGKAAPLDAAMRVRAACLDVLTRARRGSAGSGAEDADALLTVLSSHGGWDPSRDERGVVVTLRGAFKGTALVADAERQLRELGSVSASHASFSVQVVVHDATTPGPADRAADTARAKAALDALTAGGASAGTASTETVGANLPTTDPTDPRTRARNARLEVVFVARSE
jgi:hypothetical protein